MCRLSSSILLITAALSTACQRKKRVHLGLEDGTIDFYPGASFSPERAKYLYYFPNGLPKKEVLISLENQEEITDLSQVNGRLCVELGSTKADWGTKYPNFELIQMQTLTIEIAIKALSTNRGDFFASELFEIDYYKKSNNIKHLKDIGIKVHYNAFGASSDRMYLGYSRKSSLFNEEPNPEYDSAKEISVDNFPTRIAEGCVAYQFFMALEKLKNDGETQKLYDKYFK